MRCIAETPAEAPALPRWPAGGVCDAAEGRVQGFAVHHTDCGCGVTAHASALRNHHVRGRAVRSTVATQAQRYRQFATNAFAAVRGAPALVPTRARSFERDTQRA